MTRSHPPFPGEEAAQAGEAHRLLGRSGPCGVGEKPNPLQSLQKPHVPRGLELHPPHGDRDHLGLRGGDGLPHHPEVLVLAGPQDEAAFELHGTYFPGVHANPPASGPPPPPRPRPARGGPGPDKPKKASSLRRTATPLSSTPISSKTSLRVFPSKGLGSPLSHTIKPLPKGAGRPLGVRGVQDGPDHHDAPGPGL